MKVKLYYHKKVISLNFIARPKENPRMKHRLLALAALAVFSLNLSPAWAGR